MYHLYLLILTLPPSIKRAGVHLAPFDRTTASPKAQQYFHPHRTRARMADDIMTIERVMLGFARCRVFSTSLRPIYRLTPAPGRFPNSRNPTRGSAITTGADLIPPFAERLQFQNSRTTFVAIATRDACAWFGSRALLHPNVEAGPAQRGTRRRNGNSAIKGSDVRWFKHGIVGNAAARIQSVDSAMMPESWDPIMVPRRGL